MSHGDGKGDRDPWREREAAPNAWGILLFGLLGATATTVAVGQLRRTIDWFYIQTCLWALELSRSQSCSSWRNATNNANHGGFREEAWRRYQQRMQEKYEEQSERVERIRRMQNVFCRKRNEYIRSHKSWMENDTGEYHHSPHDDRYYKADTSFREQTANYKFSYKHSGSDSLSHHYSILGLDWSRAEPYSDDEIKKAFREKAMEFHPDQNQDKKEVAEAKFKEVMMSYEAIKLERSNGRC